MIQDLITRAKAQLRETTGFRAVAKALTHVHSHDRHNAGGSLSLVRQHERKKPIVFASGSNRVADMKGAYKSGIHVGVAAIILWNTVYLERALEVLRKRGDPIREDLVPHLSPLGWEHVNLTGDYVWSLSSQVAQGHLRPMSYS